MQQCFDHLPLLSPQQLFQELPLSVEDLNTIKLARKTASEIIQGKDRRLLVIVGPCSIHDPKAALEYATLLRNAADFFINDLFVIMRVYFEKPRTSMGWKGFIHDPFLNGTHDINMGLRLARRLLLDLNRLGMPTATEFLDTIIPQYYSDLISWSVIGARTSSSQIHRELASGLPMPVGFKNSLDGNVKIAIDAAKVASRSHQFLSINLEGSSSIIRTAGNPLCHIILRGSNQGPNYNKQEIKNAVDALQDADQLPYLMIDCSHGNSGKNYQLQHQVVQSITEQLWEGSAAIRGVMLESNLIAGNQNLSDKSVLTYGQSITDGCISWEETFTLLEKLAKIVHR